MEKPQSGKITLIEPSTVSDEVSVKRQIPLSHQPEVKTQQPKKYRNLLILIKGRNACNYLFKMKNQTTNHAKSTKSLKTLCLANKIQLTNQTKVANHRTHKILRKSQRLNTQKKLKKYLFVYEVQLKEQLIEFEYRYWEGGELIKKLRRKKKEKVKDLLEVCRIELVSSFKQLAQMDPKDLLFVMKDFIIPHEMALYQIEALEIKAKKNDLLMNLRNVKIKKQGKEITLSVNIDSPIRIITREKYEKNKQSYPFCNWSVLKLSPS